MFHQSEEEADKNDDSADCHLSLTVQWELVNIKNRKKRNHIMKLFSVCILDIPYIINKNNFINTMDASELLASNEARLFNFTCLAFSVSFPSSH